MQAQWTMAPTSIGIKAGQTRTQRFVDSARVRAARSRRGMMGLPPLSGKGGLDARPEQWPQRLLPGLGVDTGKLRDGLAHFSRLSVADQANAVGQPPGALGGDGGSRAAIVGVDVPGVEAPLIEQVRPPAGSRTVNFRVQFRDKGGQQAESKNSPHSPPRSASVGTASVPFVVGAFPPPVAAIGSACANPRWRRWSPGDAKAVKRRQPPPGRHRHRRKVRDVPGGSLKQADHRDGPVRLHGQPPLIRGKSITRRWAMLC